MTEPGDKAGGVGVFGLFSLSFGTIIGVGWIVVLGQWLGGAGSLGAAAAFVVGTLVIGVVAACYAEVAGIVRAPGGEIAYAERAFGAAAANAVAWLLAFIYLVVVAFETVSVGWLLTYMTPELRGAALYSVSGQQVHVGDLTIGYALLAVIAFANAHGVRVAARLQSVTTILFIVATAWFVGLGLMNGDATNLHPYFASGEGGERLRGFFIVLATTPFWFAGFSVLTQALSERSSSVSARKASGLLLASIAAAGAFYVLIIIAAAISAPRELILNAELPSAAAFGAASGSRFGVAVVLLAGTIGLLTTWNAVFFGAVRTVRHAWRGAAADLDRPGAPALRRYSLMVVVIAGVVSLLGRGGIEAIINVVGFVFSLIYMLVCIALIVLRVREPLADRPVRLPFGVAIASVGVLLSGALSVFAFVGMEPFWLGLPVEVLLLAGLGVVAMGRWLALRHGAQPLYSLMQKTKKQAAMVRRSVGEQE